VSDDCDSTTKTLKKPPVKVAFVEWYELAENVLSKSEFEAAKALRFGLFSEKSLK